MKKGDFCQMAGEKDEKQSKESFTEIIQKAYENGKNDQNMTLNKLLEELKIDLKRIV